MAFRNRNRRDDGIDAAGDPGDDDRADDEQADDDRADGTDVDDPGLVDDAAGEWLAYELHEWASESRELLARLLRSGGISHSWQGTTLLAHESVEADVDALLEEVEQAESRELDPDEEQIAFEMEGWSGALQALLAERLGRAGVPHEFDAEGDLVCHEADEEQVELVIDELLARVADEGLQDLDGLEANDLLSALFGATHRLSRDVHDSKGVLGVLAHGRRLGQSATPYGFAASVWQSLRDDAAELCDLIESEDASDREISAQATRLRDTLQGLI